MTRAGAAAPGGTSRPARVVALGGGTGLPNLLRGLRAVVGNGDPSKLTAVVTMTDDGGSSGRLRKSRGVLPPGDVRNCLVALAAEEGILASVFQHRYSASDELSGHTLGNLILAALAEQTGSFLKAVELSSRVLRTVGRILPSTLDDAVLEATLEDGSVVRGECSIASCERRIRRIDLSPRGARVTPGVAEAILEADLAAIGPGSLFTSIVPNLVVDGIGAALRETRAVVVLVANLVSERGEGAGLELEDHVAVIEDHVGASVLDGIVVNEGPIADDVLARYRSEGAHPLRWDAPTCRDVPVLKRNLMGSGPKLRHDPRATAEALLDSWAFLARGAGARPEDRAFGRNRPRVGVR